MTEASGRKISAGIAAALMLVLSAAVIRTTSANATPQLCGGHLQAGQWARVTAPRQATVTTVQDDVRPCDLTTTDGRDIYSSIDAGGHWMRATATTHGPVTSIAAEGLGTDIVVAGVGADRSTGTPAGLLISSDAGHSFDQVMGVPDDVVLAAATAPGPSFGSGKATMYLLARTAGDTQGGAPNTSTLYVSTDSGQTFIALPDSANINATRMAVDPSNGQVIWLVGAATGPAALWRSTDGGETFTRLTVTGASTMKDITLSLRDDGVVEAYAASTNGLFASESDGASWWGVGALPKGVTSARVEPQDFQVVGVVSAGGTYRSVVPAPFREMAGLPGDCTAADLSVDRAVPTTFLVRCTNGSVFRYADTSKLAPVTQFAPPADGLGPTGPPPTAVPMVQGPTWNLPNAQPAGGFTNVRSNSDLATLSGTIAFDGSTLYYLAPGDGGGGGSVPTTTTLSIYRIRASDGAPLPPISLELGAQHRQYRTDLAFDASRDRLIILTARGVNQDTSPGHAVLRVVGYDLQRHTTSTLFYMPVDPSGTAPFAEPDASTGGYLTTDTDVSAFTRRDALFKPLTTCRVDAASPDGSLGGAAVTPAGDGGGSYVELEDDQTIVRLGPTCQLLQVYSHRTVSEAQAEDDALACDGQDFPLPALWLRDAAVGTVTAWLAPGAFCPLPSTLAVFAPHTLAVGQRSTVCAQLGSNTNQTLSDLPVSVAIDGQQVAYRPTDARGRVCVPYRPHRAGARSVVARYFGRHATPQLLPSTATAVIQVGDSFTGLAAIAAAVPPAAGPVAAPVSLGPGPLPPAQPVNPQPQPQPQSQAQSQTNPQANGQAGMAAQEDEELQLAYATNRNSANAGRSRRSGSEPVLLYMTALLTTAAAAGVARRTQQREEAQRCR